MRPANLPDEAQLASARHRLTAAAQRAALNAESERRIPIRPNYQCTGGGQIRAFAGIRVRYGPPPHLLVKISQPQRGGNGERASVVNQWLRALPVELRAKAAVLLAPFDTTVAEKPRSSRIVRMRPEIFLTVQGRHRLLRLRGAQRTFAMFETMTAMMGLLGAGIFLAHAFEGIRSRA